MGDYFSFEVERVLGRLRGPKEGGVRCFVVARINDKEYYKFHVDVAICPHEILVPEAIVAQEALVFSGGEIPILALQKEELFANKIHAYTRLRLTENTRVEDLVDMAILIATGLEKARVVLAIKKSLPTAKNTQCHLKSWHRHLLPDKRILN
ncbi:hypothetical protein BH10CYA1_BH10CYA1_40570 [soil metagenome]